MSFSSFRAVGAFVFAVTLLAVASLLLPALDASAVEAAEATTPVFTPGKDNVAIAGYDPVAYFTRNQAAPGNPRIEHEWNGVTWRFVTPKNRSLFAADPEKYAPQYGGYCAYAAASGKLVKVDPEAFSVVDGKLYLNYSQKIRGKWEKDKTGYITKADAAWKKILEKP